MKGVRSLELGTSGLLFSGVDADRGRRREPRARRGRRCVAAKAAGRAERSAAVGSRSARSVAAGAIEQIHDADEDRPVVPAPVRRDPRHAPRGAAKRRHRAARRAGRCDAQARGFRRRRARARHGDERARGSRDGAALAGSSRCTSAWIRARRSSSRYTPYLYSSVRADLRGESERARNKVVILGSGPNRIGQGIEFDYCCCHAAFALREEGLETVMINCNPGNRVDRLRHGRSPVLPAADVRRRHGGDRDRAVGRRRGVVPRAVRRPDAAEARAGAAGGRRPDSRHLSRFDRPGRGSQTLCGAALGAQHHAARKRHGDVARGSARGGDADRLPGGRAAVVRARRPRHGHRVRHGHARSLHDPRGRRVARASRPRRQVSRGRLRVRRRCGRRRDRRGRHRRHHGAHRGGRHSLRRQLVRRAALHLPRSGTWRRFATTRAGSRARSKWSA